MHEHRSHAATARRAPRFLALAALSLGLVACGNDDDGSIMNPNEPGPAAASITVDPASLSLRVGETARLTVRVADKDGNELSPEVLWQSPAESVAFASMFASPEGLVHEVRAVGQGTTTLTATADEATATLQVTVTQ